MDGGSFADGICSRRTTEAKPIVAEIASDQAIYRSQGDPSQYAAHLIMRDAEWKYVCNRFDNDKLYRLSTGLVEVINWALDSSCRNRIKQM